jgi:hypothetical protein
MSVNKFHPHILVLPEDDANSGLANGFHMEISSIRQMQVLPVAGGWNEVLNQFESEHIAEMDRYSNRHMVLLIDCDGQEDRLDNARNRIPEHMRDRVFILGVLSEPEALRQDLGSLETIGMNLAKDCREEPDTTCSHHLLRHNAIELARLRQSVGEILFPSI